MVSLLLPNAFYDRKACTKNLLRSAVEKLRKFELLLSTRTTLVSLMQPVWCYILPFLPFLLYTTFFPLAKQCPKLFNDKRTSRAHPLSFFSFSVLFLGTKKESAQLQPKKSLRERRKAIKSFSLSLLTFFPRTKSIAVQVTLNAFQWFFLAKLGLVYTM